MIKMETKGRKVKEEGFTRTTMEVILDGAQHRVLMADHCAR